MKRYFECSLSAKYRGKTISEFVMLCLFVEYHQGPWQNEKLHHCFTVYIGLVGVITFQICCLVYINYMFGIYKL